MFWTARFSPQLISRYRRLKSALMQMSKSNVQGKGHARIMLWDDLEAARVELAAKEKENEAREAKKQARQATKKAKGNLRRDWLTKPRARTHGHGSARRARWRQMCLNQGTNYLGWAKFRAFGSFRQHGSMTSNESRQ
jgi:protein subunit release factor B